MLLLTRLQKVQETKCGVGAVVKSWRLQDPTLALVAYSRRSQPGLFFEHVSFLALVRATKSLNRLVWTAKTIVLYGDFVQEVLFCMNIGEERWYRRIRLWRKVESKNTNQSKRDGIWSVRQPENKINTSYITNLMDNLIREQYELCYMVEEYVVMPMRITRET